jgi:hypothetical protein
MRRDKASDVRTDGWGYGKALTPSLFPISAACPFYCAVLSDAPCDSLRVVSTPAIPTDQQRVSAFGLGGAA